MKNIIHPLRRYSVSAFVVYLWSIVLVMSGCSETDSPKGVVGNNTPAGLDNPVIIEPPISQTIAEGSTALLVVVATPPTGATLDYQWQQAAIGAADFNDVVEATNAKYTTPALSAADSGMKYRVVVTARNGAGQRSSVTSSTATLSVLSNPTISSLDKPILTMHPASQRIAAGDTARLSVSAIAPTGATLSYQWQKAAVGAADFNDVVEATGASYTTPALSAADSGMKYRVVVTARNGAGQTSSAMSNAATLSVFVVPKIVWTDINGVRRYADAPADGILLSTMLTTIATEIRSIDTIPSVVTSIGERAFMGCTGLTSLRIPSSITSVGSNAFRNCTALTTVLLEAETPPSIGNNILASSAIISIIIRVPDESVAAYRGAKNWNLIAHRIYGYHEATQIVWTDGKGTRRYADIPTDGILRSKTLTATASEIRSVDTIPMGVTRIGDSAFISCSGLTGIRIPSGITSIGNYAFFRCGSLLSIEIPVGVSSIGSYAFSISGLRSVAIPEGVTIIENYIFSECGGLSMVTLPSGVTRIGLAAFNRCLALKNVTLPNSLTSIGDFAFNICTSFTSVTIPNSVISIGLAAFQGCKGLTSITIPSSVTSIAQDVFQTCTELASVRMEATTPPAAGKNMLARTSPSLRITVPSGSEAAYKAAAIWSNYASIITGY